MSLFTRSKYGAAVTLASALLVVTIAAQQQQPPAPPESQQQGRQGRGGRQGGEGAAPAAPAPGTPTKPYVPLAASTLADHPDTYYGEFVTVTGAVEQTLSKLAFSVDQDKTKSTGKDVIVVAPTLMEPVVANSYVTIIGEVPRTPGRWHFTTGLARYAWVFVRPAPFLRIAKSRCRHQPRCRVTLRTS